MGEIFLRFLTVSIEDSDLGFTVSFGICKMSEMSDVLRTASRL